MSQNNSLRENLDDVKRIADAESAARAIEAWLNTGIKMKFNFYDEDVSYRIEGDSFHMNNHGKLIEIRGIFEDDKYEPL